MIDRSLHIPVDYELTDGVRLLAAVFGAEKAALYVLRLWIDCARQAKAWRPLAGLAADKPPGRVMWEAEALSGLIESACGFEGSRGELMTEFLAAGVIALEYKEDRVGITVPDFIELNAHLLPGFLTLQAKGGRAKAAKQKIADVTAAAGKTRQLLDLKEVLLFDESVPTKDQEDALALVMGIDSACGRQLRNASQYQGQQALMQEALRRIKRSSREEIEWVLKYLFENHGKAHCPSETEIVLRDFEKLLRYACPPDRQSEYA